MNSSTAHRPIGVLGTGSYLPKEDIDNAEVAAHCGVTEEWIESKTEILSRRYADADDATSDLAARAGAQALENAGLGPEEIDYIIVTTSTGDSPQPPTANLVQNLLGAGRAACMDLNAVCSGFVYALAVAHGLLSVDPSRRALVIAADVYSRYLDFSDHRTAVLFGDGAGAAVLGPVPAGRGFLGFDLSSRGDLHELLRVEAGGSRMPTSHETVDAGGHYVRMDGRGVTKFVMQQVPLAVKRLLAAANVEPGEIDHVVPHQANGVLLRRVVELVGVPDAKTHRTLERYGNIGSASVAVTLDEAGRSGAFKSGDSVLLAAFGGGMSIGTALLRWGTDA